VKAIPPKLLLVLIGVAIGFGLDLTPTLSQEDGARNPRGETGVSRPDGSTEYTWPDGFVEVVQQDGSMWYRAAGGDFHVVAACRNGVLSSLQTSTECRASDGGFFRFQLTYFTLTCPNDPKPKRFVISVRATNEPCDRKAFSESRARANEEFDETWDDPLPAEDQNDRPPPRDDEIFPPKGDLKPVLVGYTPGKCPDSVTWQDEEGHQYHADYDEHGVGKWDTAGPTSPPPPIPDEVNGHKVPKCLPTGHVMKPLGSGDVHFTFGLGLGGGNHNSHNDKNVDSNKAQKTDTPPPPPE